MWSCRTSTGQAEGALGDDVALDLTRTGVDRAGPAGYEQLLPPVDRVTVALGPDQPGRALQVGRDLAEALLVLAPEQLRGRRPGAGILTLGQLGQQPQAGEAHDLHMGVRPGEVLPHQR